jgi:hypothetical protein
MRIEFFHQFKKKSNLKKIHRVKPVLFHTARLMDRHVEANSRFSQFCKCGENFGMCLCLCGICNKAYFVSAQVQASLGFWIQWVQVKGMLLIVGGGVKLGCGPI